MSRACCLEKRSSASSVTHRNAVPSPATAKLPIPLDMPRPIKRKRIVTSLGSSTGVLNLIMLAAPAIPNARTSELPMMIIMSAPDTQRRICACSMDRPPRRSRDDGLCTAVTSRPMSAAVTSLPSSMKGCHRAVGAAPSLDRVKEFAKVSPRPASSVGHRSPIHTNAPHKATPAAAILMVSQGQAAIIAASTES